VAIRKIFLIQHFYLYYGLALFIIARMLWCASSAPFVSVDGLTWTLQNAANTSLNATTSKNENESLLLPPLRDHPHAGARDSQGNWGYVADVTAVRRWMLQRRRNAAKANATPGKPLNFLPIRETEEKEVVCNREPGKGYETPEAFELLQKVRVGAPDPLPPILVSVNATTTGSNSTSEVATNTSIRGFVDAFDNRSVTFRSSGKILCALYTHRGSRLKVTGIVETWGWRCDGFFAASDETVDVPNKSGFGAIDLAHAGPEK